MDKGFAVERVGTVLKLSLNRPPSNMLTIGLLDALRSEIERASKDDGVRALVLSSALPKYFSVGFDLAEMVSLSVEDQPRMFAALVACHRSLADCPKPTVAAMAGSALLGGFILALACDFRLLGKSAKVSLNEIRLGVTPTTAMVTLLSRLSGSQPLVRRMVLEGKPVRAEEALCAGIVDAVHAPEEVEAEALRFAERLAKSAPGAYGSIKRSLRKAAMGDEEAVWAACRDEFVSVFKADEAREGVLAFKEKRKPRWEN